jgi:hypothetical protein
MRVSDQDPQLDQANTSSQGPHHGPMKVASDHTIAMEGAGRPMMLQRNNTICIDKLGEMHQGEDMHVFSALYDIYALPKHQ